MPMKKADKDKSCLYMNRITGMYGTNTVTDNKTLKDGSVVSRRDDNADAARKTSEEIRL